jgi:imidazolonepropionase-like amidohydrolase
MLRGLTLNAARMLVIDGRLGSLEPGKDADVAVWSGDPFDPRNRTKIVFVNGEVAYDAARDGIRF